MKHLILFLCVIAFAGCGGISVQQVYTTTDTFSGEVRQQTSLDCGNNFCTQFTKVGDRATAYLGYSDDEWLFVEEIKMKIAGESDFLTFTGQFDRQVKSNAIIQEILTVPLDYKLASFMKRALGKRVIVRFSGKSGFIETTSSIGLNGQWAQFLAVLDIQQPLQA